MISVVLPAYREKENLQGLVPYYRSIPEVAEVIVVDDHSCDGTKEALLSPPDAGGAKLVYLENPSRIGLAPSILRGVRSAGARWILLRDSDWNHQVEDIAHFLEASEQEDVHLVVASRYAGGRLPIGRFNDVFSILLNFFLRLVWGGPGDWTYGYFMVRRDSVAAMEPLEKIFLGRGEYTLRLYRAFLTAGCKWREFATTVAPRGKGQSGTRWWKHGPSYVAVFASTLLETGRRRPGVKARYEDWAKKHGPAPRASGHGFFGWRARIRLARGEGLPERGVLLDIGCGNGAFTAFWRKISGSSVILHGVDVSENALETARREHGYDRVFPMDWKIPAVGGHSYDAIVGAEVLQYVPSAQLADFFRNWSERLRPGGSFYVLYPDRRHCLHRVRRLLLGPGHEDYNHRHDTDDLPAAFASAGLRVANWSSTGFLFPQGRFCHLIRLEKNFMP